MAEIAVNLQLYGDLAKCGDERNHYGFARLQVCLPEGSAIHDLLAHLGMPTEKRGITFINGELSAMPGLQPDLDYVLHNDDRVAFFDLRSMWPFQYRHGATMTDEMSQALSAERSGMLHHTYDEHPEAD